MQTAHAGGYTRPTATEATTVHAVAHAPAPTYIAPAGRAIYVAPPGRIAPLPVHGIGINLDTAV